MDGKMGGPATPRPPRFGSGARGPLIGWHHPGHDTPQLVGDRAKLSRRIIPAFWLAFLALPLSATFGDPHVGTGHVTVVVVLTVVFAVAYVTLMAVPDAWSAAVPPAVWVGVVLLFPTVATFLSFYDRGVWAYCFTFSLWPAAWVVRSKVLVVVGFTVWTAVVGAASGLGGSDLFSAVVIVFGVGCTFLGFWRLLEANEALRQAQADQARIAVAEERLRFSRDLHDLLGHSLSVITLKSEVAARLLPGRPEQAAVEVGEIEHVARQALWEVREAVSGYRRTTIATELNAARTALAAASMTATLDIAELGLEPALEAVLAWAVREGVTNVVRHSHARTCTIEVAHVGRQAVATVTDDGVGAAIVKEGNGLRGLSERLALVGGTLEDGPAPGGGFRLRAQVPLAPGPIPSSMPSATGPISSPPATGPISSPPATGPVSSPSASGVPSVR